MKRELRMNVNAAITTFVEELYNGKFGQVTLTLTLRWYGSLSST